MNFKISRLPNNQMPLADKQIYIVGPKGFQNDLIAAFLAQETGAHCVANSSFRQMSNTDNGQVGTQRLVLCDCLGEDPQAHMLEIETHGKRLLTQDFVTFFNVQQGLEIEERAVMLGVRGFFYQQDSVDVFLKGIRAIFNGELWLPRKIMTRCILKNKSREPHPGRDAPTLTRREREVLAMVAVGATNEEIADRLCISPHTVKTHVYNIFKKINVPNRLQAAFWAARNL
jgi:DNA-binding NarL/FixJ family response regulator